MEGLEEEMRRVVPPSYLSMVSGSVVAEVEDDHIQHASQTTGWSSNPAEEQHTLLFLYSISYQCNSNFKLFVSV